MEESIWKPIPNFEGYYECDQFGNVKSLSRTIPHKKGHRTIYERILKAKISIGYLYYGLMKIGHRTPVRRNRLVWEYHNGEIPPNHEVHHKNEIKHDDSIENLKCITKRKHQSEHKTSEIQSIYTGVFWSIKQNKWRSAINLNRQYFYLGSFTDEYDAHLAYEKALSELNKGEDLLTLYPRKRIPKSKYKWVTWDEFAQKWVLSIYIKSKRIYIRSFEEKEEEAAGKMALEIISKLKKGESIDLSKYKRIQSSQHKGICWRERSQKWEVTIIVNTVRIYLGAFKTELEALNRINEYKNLNNYESIQRKA